MLSSRSCSKRSRRPTSKVSPSRLRASGQVAWSGSASPSGSAAASFTADSEKMLTDTEALRATTW